MFFPFFCHCGYYLASFCSLYSYYRILGDFFVFVVITDNVMIYVDVLLQEFISWHVQREYFKHKPWVHPFSALLGYTEIFSSRVGPCCILPAVLLVFYPPYLVFLYTWYEHPQNVMLYFALEVSKSLNWPFFHLLIHAIQHICIWIPIYHGYYSRNPWNLKYYLQNQDVVRELFYFY